MSKRKRAQPRHNQAKVAPLKWTEEETASMLAWLDFTLTKSNLDFKSTILAHVPNSRSLSAVESKLDALWQKHGPVEIVQGLRGKEDLYSRGSVALDNPRHGIEQDLKDLIAAAKDKLETEFVANPNGAGASPKRSRVHLQKRNIAWPERKYRLRSDSLTPSTIRDTALSARLTSREASSFNLKKSPDYQVRENSTP
jgi:hypothetical protein